MSPRGGGGRGGSGRGSSISTCPGAFSDKYSQVSFANTVLFFVFFLGISIALCFVRKKSGAGKKIIGLPYTLAVFLFLLSYTLDLISAVLYECGSMNSDSYLSLLIATNVFWYLAYWTLLFVIVYMLNTMLRERLGGVTLVYKAIYLTLLGLMFALICAQMGVSSYNIWTQTEAGYNADATPLVYPAERLRLTYNILYFLTVVASGVMSLMAVFALRSRQHAVGDLISLFTALIFSMVFWTLITIVFSASYFQSDGLSFTTTEALSYIANFFQALSFVFLLCIARHEAWTKAGVVQPPQQQQQYAHENNLPPQQQQQYAHSDSYGDGQQYYHQQPPVYSSGTTGLVHGQGK